MRTRERILASLESTYREAFRAAEERGDAAGMARLDFEFQRDQLRMEVWLDIRELLAPEEESAPRAESSLLKEGSALIEKAAEFKRITRLR